MASVHVGADVDLGLQLASLVGELRVCPQATDQTLLRARQLLAASRRQSVPEDARPALRRQLAAAADQLVQLSAQLLEILENCDGEMGLELLTRGSGSATISADSGIAQQLALEAATVQRFHAACIVMLAGVQLCTKCGLPAADAATTQACQRGVALLLDCGTHILEACAQGTLYICAGAAEGPTERGVASSGPGRALVEECLETQVRLMVGLCGLDVAGMAASVDGERIVDWLEAVCDAAHALHKPALDRGKPPPAGLLDQLACILKLVLCEPHAVVRPLAEAVTQHPYILDSVLQLLEPAVRAAAVALALPEGQRPEGYSWRALDTLLSALAVPDYTRALGMHAFDAQELRRALGGAAQGGASSGLTAAAPRLVGCLVRLLETALGEYDRGGAEATTATTVVTYSGMALGNLCTGVNKLLRHAPRLAAQHWVEAYRLEPPLTKAVQLLPRVLALIAPAPLTPSQQGTQGEPGQPAPARLQHAQLVAAVCDRWASTLELLHEVGCFTEDAMARRVLCGGSRRPALRMADAPGWLAATTSALTVLPQAAAMAELLQGFGPRDGLLPALLDAPKCLAEAALYLACNAGSAFLSAFKEAAGVQAAVWQPRCILRLEPSPEELGVAAAVQAAVWTHHSTLCRCVHWLAAGGAASLPTLSMPTTKGVFQLVMASCACEGLHTAQVKAGLLAGQDLLSHRQVRAVTAASWPALLALAADMDAEVAAQPDTASTLASFVIESTSQGLAALAASDAAMQVLARLSQPPPAGCPSNVAPIVLLAAKQQPRLVPALVQADLFWPLAKAFNEDEPAKKLVSIMHALVAEVESLCQQARPGPGGSTTEHQAEAWKQRRAAAAAALKVALFRQRTVSDVGVLQRRLQAPLQELADVMQQWWRRPEQVARDGLQLAKTAVVRSCAYLCCANLAFKAGPAGQPGCGAQRCRKCRAAYYCGTACSHADWRAGHRQVCAELGAMRQQERAQQAQQAQQ